MSTANKRNQRRGAAVLLEVLRSEGARYVFGNPGTTELPLIDALVDAPDIRYVCHLSPFLPESANRQRATTQSPQGLDAQHSGDVFQFESRRTSFSQLRKSLGADGAG